MGRENQANMSLMRKLLHDKTANVLAISAAALLPIMAMVGGGIDASRYYMTAARMQAACDAGALAARRAMTDDTFTAAHRTMGLNFFDQNFGEGTFGIESRTRDFTSADGVVTGTASGRLPTTIMAAFGYNEFNLSVSCTAEINISNSDIMFVLDVTGSMACLPNGTSCSSGSGSKIVALRSAVMNFYDTVEAATSSSAQVRYGFVPYSQQANVGFSLPRAFMADTHSYQTRVARYWPAAFPDLEEGDEILVSDDTEWLPRSKSRFNSSNTNHYRFRTSDEDDREDAEDFSSDSLPGTYTVTVGGVDQTWQVFGSTEFVTGQWSGGDWYNRAGCRGRVRKTREATTQDVTPQFRDWIYCQVTPGVANPCGVNNPADSPAGWETVDLSTIYSGNTLQIPVGTNGTMITQTWSGCVEEPVWMDPNGIFASENQAAPNGDAIARHIVFMTDGEQVNNVENYSIQGIEWWDHRITGDGNSGREFTRRAARLQAICRAAQQENITIWVVAFGTTLTQNLIDCASPGRAFQANDSATLNARFQEIAQKIAALRLTS